VCHLFFCVAILLVYDVNVVKPYTGRLLLALLYKHVIYRYAFRYDHIGIILYSTVRCNSDYQVHVPYVG